MNTFQKFVSQRRKFLKSVQHTLITEIHSLSSFAIHRFPLLLWCASTLTLILISRMLLLTYWDWIVSVFVMSSGQISRFWNYLTFKLSNEYWISILRQHHSLIFFESPRLIKKFKFQRLLIIFFSLRDKLQKWMHCFHIFINFRNYVC